MCEDTMIDAFQSYHVKASVILPLNWTIGLLLEWSSRPAMASCLQEEEGILVIWLCLLLLLYYQNAFWFQASWYPIMIHWHRILQWLVVYPFQSQHRFHSDSSLTRNILYCKKEENQTRRLHMHIYERFSKYLPEDNLAVYPKQWQRLLQSLLC